VGCARAAGHCFCSWHRFCNRPAAEAGMLRDRPLGINYCADPARLMAKKEKSIA
jgi:hypothetical protein